MLDRSISSSPCSNLLVRCAPLAGIRTFVTGFVGKDIGADQSSWSGLGLASVNVGAEMPATVELYVRYFDGTTPAASSEGGSPVTYAYPEEEGPTYYKPDNVEFTAVPGTTLEYLMVFNAGSADREDVVLRANASSFLEYVPGSAKLNNNGVDDREGECEVDYWCVDENSLAVGTVGKNDTYYAVLQMMVSGAEGTATVACNSTMDCPAGTRCEVTDGMGACVAASDMETTACNDDSDCADGKVCVVIGGVGACYATPGTANPELLGKTWTEGNEACYDTTINEGVGGWVVGLPSTQGLLTTLQFREDYMNRRTACNASATKGFQHTLQPYVLQCECRG